MSHCSGTFMVAKGEGGVLKEMATGTSFASAFESTDRMQLISLSKPTASYGVWVPGDYMSSTWPTVSKVLSCRATVFMDLLLFRRNMQMAFVSAEDKCPGCKVHTGYERNFAALAPYFQISNMLVSDGDDVAVVGASAGAVLALFGAIELEVEDDDWESGGVHVVHTLGMPRPGNKAFASHVETVADFKTFTVIYYRDPMPHIPPTILGYRQSSRHFAWMYRPSAYQGKNALAKASGFFNSESITLDAYLANKVWFFRIADHLMYFAAKVIVTNARSVDDALTACGQYADEMIKETHQSDLFYF